ncbi:hypothetical protein RF11_03913 [Thelohanellus kitauei]|uniref:Uncharacterized protein n=1 Tax=Thelohanellus kitauei TaxID=669202 RepID=A0A0C2MJQ2_THEKT|nr:hypothetical protein RF11_03913 [Thelohanellus kitauei]
MATKETDTGERRQYIKTDDRDTMHHLADKIKFDDFDKTKKSGTMFRGIPWLTTEKRFVYEWRGVQENSIIFGKLPEVDSDILPCFTSHGVFVVALRKPINDLYERNADEFPKEFTDLLQDSVRFVEFSQRFKNE